MKVAAKFTVYLILFFGATWGLAFEVARSSAPKPASYTNQLDYNKAVSDANNAGRGAAMLVALAVSALLVGRVGYRRRDVLGLFVPFLGAVWLIKWLWRLANIPDNRYWLHWNAYAAWVAEHGTDEERAFVVNGGRGRPPVTEWDGEGLPPIS